MKRVALVFALCFAVALIFPVEAPAPVCGNGILEDWHDEICDYNADPTGCPPGQVCNALCECETVEECGNGIKDPGEECDGDDAEACGDTGCSSDCICNPYCGDGIKDPGITIGSRSDPVNELAQLYGC